MNYEKFVADYEAEVIDATHQDLYDFACLKIARHDLSLLISKNDFDFETENKLQNILSRLNKIHANNSYLEEKFETWNMNDNEYYIF